MLRAVRLFNGCCNQCVSFLSFCDRGAAIFEGKQYIFSKTNGDGGRRLCCGSDVSRISWGREVCRFLEKRQAVYIWKTTTVTSRVENGAAEHVLFVSRGGEKFVDFQAERCGVSDFEDRLDAAMQSQEKTRKK